MPAEPTNLTIVLILTVGFSLAAIFGYFTHYLKLSPIVGYLIAGYIIGPYSPGYVADNQLAEQLAENGVILMMFGVGMHFKWQDLVHVKNIAIPGAIIQTLISTIIATIILLALGWRLEEGIVLGLAVGVASTVVLVRVLGDNGLLNTPQGHICVGWLIVEDIITVAALLLLPSFADGSELSVQHLTLSIAIAAAKFLLLVAILFTVGSKFVAYALSKVINSRSHELFIVTILALTFVMATGSALIFGTSIALGAFIAGMIIGQTDVKRLVSASSLPLKDAFVVLFFISVGMIFDPMAIVTNFLPFICLMAVILLVKPLMAFAITVIFRYPFRTALTVALALAQIGEFSFILAEVALKYKLLPDSGYDIIVACALVSISLNPLFFRLLGKS